MDPEIGHDLEVSLLNGYNYIRGIIYQMLTTFKFKSADGTREGSVDVFVKSERGWFNGEQMARLFGHKRTAYALDHHVEASDKSLLFDLINLESVERPYSGTDPRMIFISNGGVHSLFRHSELPNDQKHEILDWHVSEVLPSIRKSGSHILQWTNPYHPNKGDGDDQNDPDEDYDDEDEDDGNADDDETPHINLERLKIRERTKIEIRRIEADVKMFRILVEADVATKKYRIDREFELRVGCMELSSLLPDPFSESVIQQCTLPNESYMETIMSKSTELSNKSSTKSIEGSVAKPSNTVAEDDFGEDSHESRKRTRQRTRQKTRQRPAKEPVEESAEKPVKKVSTGSSRQSPTSNAG